MRVVPAGAPGCVSRYPASTRNRKSDAAICEQRRRTHLIRQKVLNFRRGSACSHDTPSFPTRSAARRRPTPAERTEYGSPSREGTGRAGDEARRRTRYASASATREGLKRGLPTAHTTRQIAIAWAHREARNSGPPATARIFCGLEEERSCAPGWCGGSSDHDKRKPTGNLAPVPSPAPSIVPSGLYALSQKVNTPEDNCTQEPGPTSRRLPCR
jgi:hypothetical protein